MLTLDTRHSYSAFFRLIRQRENARYAIGNDISNQVHQNISDTILNDREAEGEMKSERFRKSIS
jgi:hypothetical protein